MNLLDAYVVEITGPVELVYDWFWLPVKYNCEGHISETRLPFKTKEMAESIKIGYEFLT